MFKNRYLIQALLIISVICVNVNDIYAEKRLNVVTSAEFLADWVRQICGDLVNVESIHDGKVDMHFFEPRPVHVIKCSKADIFITQGLDLDVWMQPLLDASRNPRIQYGAYGYIDASFGVHILQKPPVRVDMSMGDIHPFGNPHYFYDLGNVEIALENIVKGLSKNDHENSELYKRNKDIYLEELQTAFKTLKTLMEPYKGTKIVPYHMSWEYFAREFGLEIVGYFEPKPGVPPSPKHIKDLIEVIRQQNVKLILKEPYYPRRYTNKVSEQTGIKVLELINYPGGRPDAPTYLENLKANVYDLINALK